MNVPRATYRVQIHSGFTLDQARSLLPFLHWLGISHLYISPPFQARPGSTHGYDVTDPTRVNPEIGGESAFERLAAELSRLGMGLLVDIVPNHMAADSANRWWSGILRDGPDSEYAEYFDVEWSSPATGAEEKILLPVLGDPFGTSLEKRDIRLGIGPSGFCIHYYSTTLPVNPRTYGMIIEGDAGKVWERYNSDDGYRFQVDRRIDEINGRDGDPRSLDQLESLLHRQPYRLAWWQSARERINYRRFFDVSELVGLRQESTRVFEATHQLICRWVRDGLVDGLRVDHVDGLFDPRQYLDRLGSGCGGRPYLVVEKILLNGETLPGEWEVDGTTGYDFLAVTNNLFVDPAGLDRLQSTYQSFTGLNWSLADASYQQKRWIAGNLFRGEMFALGLHLAEIAEQDRHGRDLSPRECRRALLEMTACLPVYRTYIEGETVTDRDRDVIRRAADDARRRAPEISAAAYHFIERVLLLDFPPNLDAASRQAWVRLVMRWQQVSGPVAAKGVEDTALYLHNRLISMNDVGALGEAVSVDQYHAFLAERAARWPATMNTSSTHDTKRSGDVRARINVLSEIPDVWERLLRRWSRWNRDQKLVPDAPDSNEEVLLYQTMLGAWPLEASEEPAFVDRLKAYVVKATREAKVYSSWIKPDETHEKAIHHFIDAILDPERSPRFLDSFRGLVKQVSWWGMLNSLSQTLLKITAPGVPDFYQGTEFLDFSLVDPDNRRPLDLTRRVPQEWNFEDLLAHWRDGRIKAFLIRRALPARVGGDYLPVAGDDRVVSFARHGTGGWALTVVPRLVSKLAPAGKLPTGARVWKDAGLQLPPGAPEVWTNVFTGEQVASRRLADILAGFPVALLRDQTGNQTVK